MQSKLLAEQLLQVAGLVPAMDFQVAMFVFFTYIAEFIISGIGRFVKLGFIAVVRLVEKFNFKKWEKHLKLLLYIGNGFLIVDVYNHILTGFC